MFDTEIIKAVLEAGIAAVALSVMGFLFLQIVKRQMKQHDDMAERHKEERKEWLRSSEEQSDRIADAIDGLARSINDDRLRSGNKTGD